jgi:hypothetical protein
MAAGFPQARSAGSFVELAHYAPSRPVSEQHPWLASLLPVGILKSIPSIAQFHNQALKSYTDDD